MNLEDFLDKVLTEKLKEKEAILKEAQTKKEEILSQFRDEAQSYFDDYVAKEKFKIESQFKEAIFKLRLKAKKNILEEKEKIKKEALFKLKDYLSKSPHLLPKKKLVFSNRVEEVLLDIDEFLELVEKQAQQRLKEVI